MWIRQHPASEEVMKVGKKVKFFFKPVENREANLLPPAIDR